MRRRTTDHRSAFTLIELLIVVAILAILAGLVVTRMSTVTQRSQSGTAASNTADVVRMVETYRAVHGSYADGWDTLVSAAENTSLISSVSPLLASLLSAPSVISDDAANSLRLVGINHVYYHDTTFNGPPSDSGQVSTHFFSHGSSSASANVVKLAVRSPTTFNGSDGSAAYYLLANEFNLPSFFSTGTDTSFIGTHDFYVFGLGPKNWMVSETLMSAPLFDVHDVGRYYSRALVIFAVPKAGVDQAQFIGVIGPDGKGVQSYLSDYHKQAPRDH